MSALGRMIKARTRLILEHGFYGTLALHLDLVEKQRDNPTMATDGRRVIYNPDFVGECSDPELMGVLAHEVMHCANMHHTRRRKRDPEMWNVACDYAINPELKKAGFKLPGQHLDEPEFHGLSADDIYRLLEQKQQQKEDQQQDQQSAGNIGDDGDGQAESQDQGQSVPSDGKGNEGEDKQDQGDGDTGGVDDQGAPGTDPMADGSADDGDPGENSANPGSGDGGSGGGSVPISDPGRCGAVLDASESEAEAGEVEAEWQTIVRQAVAVATRGAGYLPGDLERLVAEMKQPRIDWREVLRRFIDPSSRQDFSFQNPDRRFPGASFVLPGNIVDGLNHVVCLVDVSGSIDTKAYDRFVAELQAAMDEGAIDTITVATIDTIIHQVTEYKNGERIDPTIKGGGGGTHFRPAWQWIKDNAQDATAAIYFTDLCSQDGFGDEPFCPILWAVYGDPREIRSRMACVPFGECIELVD